MLSIKKYLAVITLTFFLFPFVHSQGIDFVHDKSFQEVLDMAKAQNKLVFMDCYTTWCGPCKRLAAMVFPDPEAGEFFNANFVNTKFDMEHDEGPTISRKYGIRAYPTLLWIDGNGEVVHQVVGGLDVQGLIQNGKKAIDPTPGILNGMRTRYSQGERSLGFMTTYLNLLQKVGEKYDDVFTEYLSMLTTQQLKDTAYAPTIFSLTTHINSPGMKAVLDNKKQIVDQLGEEPYGQKINQIATKAVQQAINSKDDQVFQRAVDLLKENKADDHQKKILELSIDYYSRVNDWVNYDKSATAYIKKYAPDNAPLLNDVAWNYFLNINEKPLLQKAAKWAYEAVNTDNKYTYNITYAYLLYKLKDFKEAEKACDYAIIKAKEERVLPASANALKEAIKKESGE